VSGALSFREDARGRAGHCSQRSRRSLTRCDGAANSERQHNRIAGRGGGGFRYPGNPQLLVVPAPAWRDQEILRGKLVGPLRHCVRLSAMTFIDVVAAWLKLA